MHVDEVAQDPELLAAYARRFSIADDATLVLYAPGADPDRVGDVLGDALVAAGMHEDRAPHATLVLEPAHEAGPMLSARAAIVLSRRAARPGLTSITHCGPDAIVLLHALAAGRLPRLSRTGGLGTALVGGVILAAGGPDVEDNVDHLRYVNGQPAPAPEAWPGLLAAQLANADALEPLWDVLDEGSREVLVALLSYKVLGNRKVRMPVGPYSTLRRSAQEIQDRMLVEAETDDPEFLGWILGRYDLAALGLPIELHSHPRLIINEFMLEQYRAPAPVDVSVRPGDVVIDGGGCWGESALHFAHLSGPGGRVETFEFEPGNLRRLYRNLELNPRLAERISVNERPLWRAADERVSFRSDGPATRLDGGAADGVLTGSIDALVASGQVDRVDFVKLDIEGSELAALEGAAETLRRFRPRLAIAAYHRADDLLELPAFIAGLGLGYRFAIGHYTMSDEETVLFAWCD
jgi:FkbM family methyltransferase